jgi:1-phosphofructokinase family hexose kinase
MIVSVTPNTVIDRVLFVPSFELNKTIRASKVVVGGSGKAADASWVLGELGIPSLALGFAAGRTGHQLEDMLRAKGVEVDFTWVGGETRVSTLIVCEDGSGQSTITVSTLEVSPEHVLAMHEKYRTALDEAPCVVMGGSLPRGVAPELYREFIQMARERDIPVVFDASGEGLRAGLEGGPTFVKPNRDELEALTRKRVASFEDAYRAARALQERYGISPVVTLGEAGALAVLSDRAYRIPPPKVDIVNTAGAGDAVLAGLAAALARGEPIENGLRLGFAAAGAVMMTPITADCRRADVERLLPTIELNPYP